MRGPGSPIVLSQDARGAIIGWTWPSSARATELLAAATPCSGGVRARAGCDRALARESGRWSAPLPVGSPLAAASGGRVEVLLFQDGVDRQAFQCPATASMPRTANARSTARASSLTRRARSRRPPDARPRRRRCRRCAAARISSRSRGSRRCCDTEVRMLLSPARSSKSPRSRRAGSRNRDRPAESTRRSPRTRPGRWR